MWQSCVVGDQRWPASGGCSSVSCFADTEIFSFICLFGRVSSGEKQQHEVCQTINGYFVLSPGCHSSYLRDSGGVKDKTVCQIL